MDQVFFLTKHRNREQLSFYERELEASYSHTLMIARVINSESITEIIALHILVMITKRPLHLFYASIFRILSYKLLYNSNHKPMKCVLFPLS